MFGRIETMGKTTRKVRKVNKGRYIATLNDIEYLVVNFHAEGGRLNDNAWLVVRQHDGHVAPQRYETKKAALQAITSGEADLTDREFTIRQHVAMLKTHIYLGDDLQPFWNSAVMRGDGWMVEALERVTS